MTTASQNPPTQKKLEFQSPQQMASFMLLEASIASLQTAMNQTAYLGQSDASQAFIEAQALLGKRRDELLDAWSRKVQLAPAGLIVDGKATAH